MHSPPTDAPGIAAQTRVRMPLLTWLVTSDRVVFALFIIQVIALAFDFKAKPAESGATGGSAPQMLMVMVSLGAGGTLILLRAKYLLSRPGVYLIAIWGSGLFMGLIAAVFNHTNIGHAIRMGLPPALLLVGLCSMCVMGASGIRPIKLIWVLFAGWAINIVFRYLHGLFFWGLTINEIRVEVLSPTIPLAVSFIVVSFFLKKKPPRIAFVVLAIILFVIVTSITRTFILVSAIVSLLAFLGLMYSLYWKAVTPLHAIKRIGLVSSAGLFVVAVIGGILVVLPETGDRWVSRMTNDYEKDMIGVDPSLLMRISETEDIINRAKSRKMTMLIGHGYGAAYGFSMTQVPMLQVFYDIDGEHKWVLEERWVSSDSTWFYNLLTGGVFGVMTVALFFIVSGWFAVKAVIETVRIGGFDEEGWSVYVPLLAIVAMFIMCLLFNPFSERYGGMCFGLIAGLPQAYLLRALRARSKATNQPNPVLAHYVIPPIPTYGRAQAPSR